MVMRWNVEGDVCYTTESGIAFSDQALVARAILGAGDGDSVDVKIYEGTEAVAAKMICRIAHTTPAGIAVSATPFELGFFLSEGCYVEVSGTGGVTLVKGRK